MHMAPACLLLCRSNENWHSHRSTSEPGSCAVGGGAAYALLHRGNRRMHHLRSESLVHLKKSKCTHNSRFVIAELYRASSTAAHLPHRQLFGKLFALPAPGRGPLNPGRASSVLIRCSFNPTFEVFYYEGWLLFCPERNEPFGVQVLHL